jgi:uncharacterized protein YggU (UPF0235/DUF167 family)
MTQSSFGFPKEAILIPGKWINETAFDLTIRVTPKSSKNAVGKIVRDAKGRSFLQIFVTVAPENNQANRMALSVISKHFKLPISNVTLEKGATQRMKIIRIILRDKETFSEVLRAMGDE